MTDTLTNMVESNLQSAMDNDSSSAMQDIHILPAVNKKPVDNTALD